MRSSAIRIRISMLSFMISVGGGLGITIILQIKTELIFFNFHKT